MWIFLFTSPVWRQKLKQLHQRGLRRWVPIATTMVQQGELRSPRVIWSSAKTALNYSIYYQIVGVAILECAGVQPKPSHVQWVAGRFLAQWWHRNACGRTSPWCGPRTPVICLGCVGLPQNSLVGRLTQVFFGTVLFQLEETKKVRSQMETEM